MLAETFQTFCSGADGAAACGGAGSHTACAEEWPFTCFQAAPVVQFDVAFAYPARFNNTELQNTVNAGLLALKETGQMHGSLAWLVHLASLLAFTACLLAATACLQLTVADGWWLCTHMHEATCSAPVLWQTPLDNPWPHLAQTSSHSSRRSS